MNDAERAILLIFRRFDVGRDQMLQFSSFTSALDDFGLTMAQFHQGMESLIQKECVEVKDQGPPGAYFLKVAGYEESLLA